MALTKVTTNVIDMSGNTGGLTWAKGTTAQRPSGVLGDLRENTDDKRTEIYTDQTGTSEWRRLKETGTGFSVSYLVIAGGGGGGSAIVGAGNGSGGGGAGGYLTNFGGTALSLSPGTYDIEVGTGGAGSSGATQGTNGGNSVFASITATGGGGGGAGDGTGINKGKDGGSGGGGATGVGANT